MKRTSYQTGLFAEAVCQWYLRLKFYHILALRFKSKLGEIDIIARRGNTIAMIEVKARPSQREAIEAVSPRQRQRLQRGTLDFLAKHPHLNHCTIRFDVMLVTPRRLPVHMQDAWRPHS